MLRLGCITVIAALALSADVSQALHVRPQTPEPSQMPATSTIPRLPSFSGEPTSALAADSGNTQPNLPSERPSREAPDRKPTTLTEESKLNIIRFVSGEFVRLVAPLPGGKKGFSMKAGAPLDQTELRKAIVANGAVLNAGDRVQITKIDFKGREIQFDINGGARGHHSWRDHIQLDLGGMSPVATSSTTSDPNRAIVQPQTGATVYLDFGRALPDMTADQLKGYLSGIFDFSKRSAAVQWIQTLPPKIQKAIAAKRAELGMSRDEVMAAIGRPDQKVRELDADGNPTEDWIYGKPPANTTFVKFIGDKVVKIDRYP